MTDMQARLVRALSELARLVHGPLFEVAADAIRGRVAGEWSPTPNRPGPGP